MKEGWVRGEVCFSNTVDWINNLRKTLTILHEAARKNEEAFKDKTKAAYDEKAQERHFEPGDMVLCHTPGLTGKLHSIWAGPYEVTAKISDTNYKLAVPDKRSHTEVVHINRLKEWKTPTANLFWVVVADKSGDSPDPIGKVRMGTPALTSDQKSELQMLLEEFSDVVTTELGKVLGTEHVIDTGQVQPIRTAPYRIVPRWRAELKAEIHSLVRQGILVPTRSPWSSPMVPVRKLSGLIRLCIDYRKLNNATKADPYQMPVVQDLLDDVAGATWLSKLDMNKGFYQVPLQTGSQEKTAFCSPWGKFAFTRMPFGLRNAPATFQRCMDQALDQQAECSSTYIDDVLVYSSSWKEHLKHLRDVLEALRKAGLTAKPDKCVWGAQSLEYLGHEVGNGVVSVPEARVKALRDFARPINKKGLRAFLGTAGYYRRFIPGFSQRAGPLYDALKRGAPNFVGWTGEQIGAFNHLICVLCDTHTLTLPRDDDILALHTDASSGGIGAVLSVVRDGQDQPVAYFSKRLTPAERNYSVTELECLAVVKAIDHFAIHLLGRDFTVVTDHTALVALKHSHKLNGRLMRWALTLQAYKYEVVYRPGVLHQNADGLSRQSWPEMNNSLEEDAQHEMQCQEGGASSVDLHVQTWMEQRPQVGSTFSWGICQGSPDMAKPGHSL